MIKVKIVFWCAWIFACSIDIDGMPATSSTDQGHKELDIAFLMDTTGSMGSYINNARENVHQVATELVQSSHANVRMALVEYRDHPPQETTFVIRQHDFTSSLSAMETWLNAASAAGGGDTPEAVADALDSATKLSWRTKSTKIAVLISDAPPHGLIREDRSFTDGCPNGYDPMKTVRSLAEMDVTLYSVGCEPSIVPYTDFVMALAYLTGGQYLPLNNPNALIDAIIGGAHEELSLQKFENLVHNEIQKAISESSAVAINKTQIVQSVYEKLSQQGATSMTLLRNNQTLGNVTEEALRIAACTSMAEVRKIFKPRPGPAVHWGGGWGGHSPWSYGGGGAGSGTSGGSYHPDSYSWASTGVSVDQIGRLVNKEIAKVTTPSP